MHVEIVVKLHVLVVLRNQITRMTICHFTKIHICKQKKPSIRQLTDERPTLLQIEKSFN